MCNSCRDTGKCRDTEKRLSKEDWGILYRDKIEYFRKNINDN